jgi:predicted enzyme related to lactoylglutathione lyase
MISKLSLITVFVHNQDDALRFYTEKLGFEKRSDDSQTLGSFLWLTVAPKEQKEVEIVLLKAEDKEQKDLVGKQSNIGFETDDCRETYETLRSRGVKFTSPPEQAQWGLQALFEDLYGNEFVLIERRQR